MTYHEVETTNGTRLRLTESVTHEGDLSLALQAGNLTIRATLNEDTATQIADALNSWYFSKYFDTKHYGADPLPIDEMDDWLNPTTPTKFIPVTFDDEAGAYVPTGADVAIDLTTAHHIRDATIEPETVSSHDFYDTIREYKSGRDGITYTIPNL